MPSDLAKVHQQKERIMSYIQHKGPSLPVAIAQALGVSTLFASAFLSELFGDRKLRLSNMKVGSSSLYYIVGQEAQLENFVQYLNNREREAFELLKSEKVLDDDKQTPVVRVALRAIKDFAIPLRIRVGGDVKLFWKYFLLPDSEVELYIKLPTVAEKAPVVSESVQPVAEVSVPAQPVVDLTPPASEVKEIPREPVAAVAPVVDMTSSEPVVEVRKEQAVIAEEPEEEETEEEKPAVKEAVASKTSKKSTAKIEDHEFPLQVKSYLRKKNIELGEILVSKKKEFVAKVFVEETFGKQGYYLSAKEKKSVNDNDLAMALHNAQNEKMPCLVLSVGDLNSKGKEYLKTWNNLVKFDKLKN